MTTENTMHVLSFAAFCFRNNIFIVYILYTVGQTFRGIQNKWTVSKLNMHWTAVSPVTQSPEFIKKLEHAIQTS